MLGRRRRERVQAAAAQAVDTGRWQEWCRRCREGRRPEDAVALLARLREAAQGPPQTAAAALAALAEDPAALLLLLDRHARAGGPAPVAQPTVRVPRVCAGTRPRSGRQSERQDPQSAALGRVLAAMEADGRVREAAVDALASASGPLSAALLAVRAADHVPEVRRKAAAALVARTAPDEVAAVVGVLLRTARRHGAQVLGDTYRAALCEPSARRAVRALAAAADPPVRRYGVELALDLGAYVRGDLLRTALYDRDQVCRRLCAQRLLELDPGQAERLLRARGAGVRELAVVALSADVPATRLLGPLADRARMVRAQARWKLYQREEPPAEVYRTQLRRAVKRDAPARLLAGLATGLGECGDAADAAQLARLLPDPRPQVRRAAAGAVGRLAKPYELVPLLGPLANDPDPGVAREVFEALARVPCDVPPETVWIGRTRTEPAVRRLAERITARGRAARAEQAQPADLQSGHSPR
ncbi:HEAT repeat domain-containing protein [Actinacidiphila guanduensis]|uniref:HEAT repeat-containing protein n=1 Tax=Actinacidiphila guanduensis TaxID=310781 RepID=A0A1G9ZY13_9ACTN|nr:HEAT repeat domain-containing protein [Actinacidiphila guanduensis]SDN25791.1 HEAT repeat-containing protein [Actinacidiphila guanduensis]